MSTQKLKSDLSIDHPQSSLLCTCLLLVILPSGPYILKFNQAKLISKPQASATDQLLVYTVLTLCLQDKLSSSSVQVNLYGRAAGSSLKLSAMTSDTSSWT